MSIILIWFLLVNWEESAVLWHQRFHNGRRSNLTWKAIWCETQGAVCNFAINFNFNSSNAIQHFLNVIFPILSGQWSYLRGTPLSKFDLKSNLVQRSLQSASLLSTDTCRWEYSPLHTIQCYTLIFLVGTFRLFLVLLLSADTSLDEHSSNAIQHFLNVTFPILSGRWVQAKSHLRGTPQQHPPS